MSDIYRSRNFLFTVKAMYLGSEPMGELLEGENGSDAIQVPLKRTILRTDGVGEEVELSMTNDSLLVTFLNKKSPIDAFQSSSSKHLNRISLPIEFLAYCGALRQLPSDRITDREFETLDKSPNLNRNDPPLFVTIFRSFENESTLFCHSFVVRRDDEAMELVKLIMEIYYNLIKLQDSDDSSHKANRLHDFIPSNHSTNLIVQSTRHDNLEGLNIKSLDNVTSANSYQSDAELNHLLDVYNKVKIDDSLNKRNANFENLTSTNDFVKRALDSNEFELVTKPEEVSKALSGLQNLEQLNGEDLNKDDNPIIIRKPNNQQVVYKQNVYIRWLQPPTPPPPAPIIIREIQEPGPEQPPLVIYKQQPQPPTPPPLVIREKPPSPVDLPKEPLIIEKRVPAKEHQRKVIIEQLPPIPAKPRDIILEKWLSRDPAPRAVYYQKASKQKPIYEKIDHHNDKYEQHVYRDSKRSKSKSKRSSSNELIYAPSSQVYSSDNSIQLYSPPERYYSGYQQTANPKVAGYRIIRQIIPGPNSTPADIEKALARSQRVNTTYANPKIYSSYGTSNIGYPIYSGNQNYYGLYNTNYYRPQQQQQQQPIYYSQSYVPTTTTTVYQGQMSNSRRDVYRSSSIDNF